MCIGRDAEGEFFRKEYDVKCLLKYVIGTRLYVMQFFFGGGLSCGLFELWIFES